MISKHPNPNGLARSRKQLFLGVSLFLFLVAPMPVGASESTAASDTSNLTTFRELVLNRTLLSRYRVEYVKLKKQYNDAPTEAIKRKMTQARYKVRALQEEAARLRSLLKKNETADAFIDDMVYRQKEAQDWQASEIVPKFAGKTRIVESKEAFSRRLHEKALNLVAKDKLLDAAAAYEEIVLSNPDDDEAYLLMGHCYLLSDELDKARTAFFNAVHIDGSNIHEITPFYENPILNNPDDDTLYANLGYAYLILGENDRAKSAFHDALEINPANERALKGLQLIGTFK